MMHFIQCLLYI